MNQIPDIEERVKDIFIELHNSIELSLGNKRSIKWALQQKQEDVISTIHHQLQKAREDWLRELTEGVLIGSDGTRNCYFIPCERLDRYQKELDELPTNPTKDGI